MLFIHSNLLFQNLKSKRCMQVWFRNYIKTYLLPEYTLGLPERNSGTDKEQLVLSSFNRKANAAQYLKKFHNSICLTRSPAMFLGSPSTQRLVQPLLSFGSQPKPR
ncbi:hypothetical protein HS088_TW21G01666 [Tripterygium wilfordii]|uniref:Uncharacterized protein n=3 Tax=Tripterygium wilfordii TaxID=458696 RepID=A0A7J7C5V3_TRIWF|nr:hypothetical protein HS088_TW21G01666 [Tripterygium wilfordii]